MRFIKLYDPGDNKEVLINTERILEVFIDGNNTAQCLTLINEDRVYTHLKHNTSLDEMEKILNGVYE